MILVQSESGELLCLDWGDGMAVQRVAVAMEYKKKRRLMVANSFVPWGFRVLCVFEDRSQWSCK